MAVVSAGCVVCSWGTRGRLRPCGRARPRGTRCHAHRIAAAGHQREAAAVVGRVHKARREQHAGLRGREPAQPRDEGAVAALGRVHVAACSGGGRGNAGPGQVGPALCTQRSVRRGVAAVARSRRSTANGASEMACGAVHSASSWDCSQFDATLCHAHPTSAADGNQDHLAGHAQLLTPLLHINECTLVFLTR